MFKLISGIVLSSVLSLSVAQAAAPTGPVIESPQVQQYRDQFSKWFCTNDKKVKFPGFPSGDGRFAPLAKFADPFTHLVHVYVVDKASGVEFEVEVQLGKDNKLIDQCINGMGVLMFNAKELQKLQSPTNPQAQDQDAAPSTGDDNNRL